MSTIISNVHIVRSAYGRLVLIVLGNFWPTFEQLLVIGATFYGSSNLKQCFASLSNF